jgi:hypothetical protein
LTTYEVDTTRREAIGHAWVVGQNETRILGDGWFDRTVDGRCGLTVRPSMATGGFLHFTDLPASGTLHLMLSTAATAMQQEITVTGTLKNDADESIIAEISWTFHDDLWRMVLLEWSLDSAGTADAIPRVTLQLSTSVAFIPHQLLGNGDYRAMGCGLATVRLSDG